MRKKAQGLSLNTIIVAAIVLIVLVVLWAIFTGRMGIFTGGLKKQGEGKCDDAVSAGGHGGKWQAACDDTERLVVAEDASLNPGQVCCVTK